MVADGVFKAKDELELGMRCEPALRRKARY
jgi:hypothetical protein